MTMPSAMQPFLAHAGEPVLAATYMAPPNDGGGSGGIRFLDFLASIIGIRVREKASARILALGHSGRVHMLHVDADSGELFSHATLDSVAGLDIRHDPAKYEYAVRGTVNGQPFNERVFAYPVGGDYSPEERAAFGPMADQIVRRLSQLSGG
jgi:hypothetical protein